MSTLLVQAFAQLPLQIVVRRFGVRRSLTIMLLLWATSVMLTGVATGSAVVIGLRVLLGLVESPMWFIAMWVIHCWYDGPQFIGALNFMMIFNPLFSSAISLSTPVILHQLDGVAAWAPRFSRHDRIVAEK